jgi:hypothetical protein
MSLSEVFTNPYNAKLDVIMGRHPFFLDMSDTEEYTRDTTNVRMVMQQSGRLNCPVGPPTCLNILWKNLSATPTLPLIIGRTVKSYLP